MSGKRPADYPYQEPKEVPSRVGGEESDDIDKDGDCYGGVSPKQINIAVACLHPVACVGNHLRDELQAFLFVQFSFFHIEIVFEVDDFSLFYKPSMALKSGKMMLLAFLPTFFDANIIKFII